MKPGHCCRPPRGEAGWDRHVACSKTWRGQLIDLWSWVCVRCGAVWYTNEFDPTWSGKGGVRTEFPVGPQTDEKKETHP